MKTPIIPTAGYMKSAQVVIAMQRGFSTRKLPEKTCRNRTECFSTHFQDPSQVSQSTSEDPEARR